MHGAKQTSRVFECQRRRSPVTSRSCIHRRDFLLCPNDWTSACGRHRLLNETDLRAFIRTWRIAMKWTLLPFVSGVKLVPFCLCCDWSNLDNYLLPCVKAHSYEAFLNARLNVAACHAVVFPMQLVFLNCFYLTTCVFPTYQLHLLLPQCDAGVALPW